MGVSFWFLLVTIHPSVGGAYLIGGTYGGHGGHLANIQEAQRQPFSISPISLLP